MNQAELNLYWVQTILYYCFQINNGSTYFDTWASSCGSWGYDENDNLYITGWNLDNEQYNITQPTINTLLSYDVQNVIDFHNQYYLYVNDIYNANQNMYYFAPSTQLNSIPPTRLSALDGFRVFDTTLKRVVFWNNSLQQWQES